MVDVLDAGEVEREHRVVVCVRCAQVSSGGFRWILRKGVSHGHFANEGMRRFRALPDIPEMLLDSLRRRKILLDPRHIFPNTK